MEKSSPSEKNMNANKDEKMDAKASDSLGCLLRDCQGPVAREIDREINKIKD